MTPSAHTTRYLDAAARLVQAIDGEQIDAIVRGLARVRDRNGRLFVLGVGGGAGHASHAVNDFRKLCQIESYAPTDNVSELTARVNDEGWETSFSAWLEVSRLGPDDAVLAFSVGGGSREHNVSVNLVNALEAAQRADAAIFGVVGAPGGALAELADTAIVIDPPDHLCTPLVEALQAVVWHALVSHPGLAARQGHWETIRRVSPRAGVFVDRDGVICELVSNPRSGLPESPLDPEQVRLIAGASGALTSLRTAGFALLCVSNQPAAAKGTVTTQRLHQVNDRVRDLLRDEGLELDSWRMCLHHPDGTVAELTGECECRKPAPGMLLDGARELGLNLSRSWMLGDTDADVLAGGAAGCATVLIANPGSAHKRSGESDPDYVVADLLHAADAVLHDRRHKAISGEVRSARKRNPS